MRSALYIGSLKHRRRLPRAHAFRYPLFMVLLDLAELPTVFARRWLWGIERRTVAAFWRADHFGDPARPLDLCVRELVEREAGVRPNGPIRLLTHLRYLGHCFNPVSFYYCFDAADRELLAVVAEVNNTPWGERHCYVLGPATCTRPAAAGSARVQRWLTPKQMHVSPFMPMDMDYEWGLSMPGETLQVRMQCRRGSQTVFVAMLELARRPLRSRDMALTLLRFPVMTLSVVVGIHWQALRLWLKRIPVHAHATAPKSPG